MTRAVARISVLWVLAAGLTAFASRPIPVALGQPTRPNILVIVTDDQRVDTFGVMPRTRQWFGKGGSEFVNAFATTPLCCPSRASIMTGRYAHNHNVETNASAALLDQRGTIQRLLQEEGYGTAVVGKFLNGWEGDPLYFDRWSIFVDPIRYTNARLNVDGSIRKVKRYSTDYLASKASSLMSSFEGQDPEPWFLYVAPFAPHDPYEPARKYRDARVGKWPGNPAVREKDRGDKPEWVRGKRRQTTLKEGREIRAAQLRTLISVDDLVDKLFRTLGTLGEQTSTLALFVSDNGKHWGEHRLGGKQDPYTHSIRIPLYMRWPGRVAPGFADPRLALNVDVAATALDAAGVPSDPEYPLDGRSLLDPSWTRARVYTENKFGGRGFPSWSSIRTADHQYIEWYDETLQSISFREYYNLSSDPWQLTNLLADDDPSNDPPDDELAALSLQIVQDRRCEGTVGPAACP